ncbi:MAG TPA: DNA/RNA non-specific endonuclease [Myxococcaceae bacterium]|nr:DNA/RNA non-specific endonuclease [Myxococcaceae bacterium]
MRFRPLGAACLATLALSLAACSEPGVMDASEVPSSFGTSRAALTATPELVLTEIMPNPRAVYDSKGEWFEVHNPGSEPVDLEGWTISSNNDYPHTISASVVVPPGGYVVLARNADASSNGGAPAAYAYGNLNFANSSDWIALSDADGNPVDNVAWTSSPPNGASLALINPACDNAEASGAAWKASTVVFGAGDRGTPGVVNGPLETCPEPPPPLPRDVRINEVMPNPYAVYDSNGEWFEVFNPGSAPIDLQGWKIASKGDAEHIISASVVVPARGYVVLGNNTDSTTNGGVTVAYTYGSGLALSNSTDWLELRRPEAGGDVTIDAVYWNSAPPSGSSRALVKPAAPNASDVSGSAWTTSTEYYGPVSAPKRDRGSPGAANPGPRSGVSVIINDPARLPVGYVKPAYVTVRDPDGAIVSPLPPLTWSSSDPTVAVVDERGYITAVGEGTVFIKASLEDGITGAAFLTVLPAQAPTSAQYGNHLEFGIPLDATSEDELLIRRDQFALSYNVARGGPNWVSWNLEASHFGTADRCNCFTPEPELPADAYLVTDLDYRGSGYDRGHVVQSYNRTTTEQENATTYLLSNILPQSPENNQGPWARFESYLSDVARNQGKEIYIVAGGAWSATSPTLKGQGKVSIPDYTWKVAVVMDADEGLGDVRSWDDVQVLAVWMPNLVGASGPASADGIKSHPWETYETTVDAIEAATGYDLLALLPDTIERVVESKDRAPVAHVDGPDSTWEGTGVSFTAAGSTDPDGDVLTYTWDFGDGTQGEGVAPSHTFADDGVYTVTVTVTDPYGAYSTASLPVLVSNVAPLVGTLSGATLLPGEFYIASGTFVDPGQDTWSATVDYGDGSGVRSLALAGQGFTLGHLYGAAGTYTVRVSVTDDEGGTGERSAQVVVQTQQEALLVLEAMVRELAGHQAQSLNAKLEAARKQLDRGHATPAVNMLGAFQNEVEALVRSGRLASGSGQQLTGMAGRIVRSLK